MNQAVEIFVTFNEGRPLPEYVRWRDIAEVLAGASSKARSKITSRSCSVDSSPNKQWQPRWGFEGKPHDVVIYTTKAGPRPLAATQHPEGIRQAVADFLERWLADTPPSEEEATASFLYVVLSRPPTRNDYVIDVRNVGPLVEFGFGEAPAAPEEWESIPLGDLIRRATHWLRATNSS